VYVKEGKVRAEWRKLHNEDLQNSYFSPNIVGVIKSRIMRWAGRVARMVFGGGILNKEGQMEGPGRDG
jgi:hypothetical protein